MNKPISIAAPTLLKLIKIGNDTAVVLPEDMLAKLGAANGDKLYATETPDGVQLSATDPQFQKKMGLAENIMREDRDILRELAK